MTTLDKFVPAGAERLQVLDGWRGTSILFVLAAHFLPLGPKSWFLNATAGPLGMCLFFTLSGFLITNFLLHRSSVIDFIFRRFFRIVPLAWLGMAFGLWMSRAEGDFYLPHFLFYANLPPIRLTDITAHMWSLCVEVQFYIGIAGLFALLRQRGLVLIPFICLFITAVRIYNGVEISIVTYFRVDEILAGGILALAFNNKHGLSLRMIIVSTNPYVLLCLLLVSCHPESGIANYLRPYLAAMLVGVTLLNGESRLAHVMKSRTLAYIAAISFALYVVHPLVADTWLGSGEALTKYIKRPFLIAAIFVLAHVSTFYYENRWIALGKNLSSRVTLKFVK